MSLLDRVQRKTEEAASSAEPAPALPPAAAPPAQSHSVPAERGPSPNPSQSGGHAPAASPAPPTRETTPAPSEAEAASGNGWGVRDTRDLPAATTPPPARSAAVIPAKPPANPLLGRTSGSEASPPNQQSSLLNRTGLARSGLAGKASASAAGYSSIRTKVHQRLIEEVAGNADSSPPEVVRQRISELVNEVVVEQALTLTRQDRNRIVETVIHDVLGLGPLEALLADEEVSEIMINGPKQIYVERKGKLTVSPITFESNDQLLQVIDRIVSSIGRRVDESSPMVDARLKDGSRVNVIIPPLALRGPTVTIRKFAKDALQVDDLVKNGSITDDMVTFLRACVRGRLNVVVSGGTGSGKTTTLNILSGFIPEDERIVTIEDAAELQLRQDHVVTLETRPANVEGKGRIAIRDLVINSLRMRPDRIVIGECRGGEALDMLQAMNTGHDGSLTTLHANNPKECISRMETLVLMAGADLPSRAIREQIGSAINIIVQQSRLRDGSRKIVSVAEVLGVDNESVKIQELFAFRQVGIDEDGKVIGHYTATGVIPHFLEHLMQSGEAVSEDIFTVTEAPSTQGLAKTLVDALEGSAV